MPRWFLFVCAVCLFVLPLRAQGDAQKRYNEEFKRGYDLLVAKKYDEGMASMKRCLEMRPETPLCAYNLACGHALQGQTDAAIEWFGKCVDWGFGVDGLQDPVMLTQKDTDFDSIRADPRFVALMDKMKAQRKVAEEYRATPAVYVPEKLSQAAEVPVLVVLHASSATKDSVLNARWKKIADELGLALVAPSARLLRSVDPSKGADWWGDLGDYAIPQRSFVYEKTVNDAVDAFKKQHKIDRSRVFIAGENEGAVVALHVAMAYPGLYKGVVALDGSVIQQMLAEKAPNAVKAGLKVRVLVDREALAKRIAAEAGDPKPDAQKILDGWSTQLTGWGFANALTAFTRDEKDPGQVDKLLSEALKAMLPQAVEAAAPK